MDNEKKRKKGKKEVKEIMGFRRQVDFGDVDEKVVNEARFLELQRRETHSG